MATADMWERVMPKHKGGSNLAGKVACPPTEWDVEGLTAEGRSCEIPTHDFPLWLTPEKLGSEVFKANVDIMQQVETHGAVMLRGFSNTKSPADIHKMYTALGLVPCEDPLSNTGLRKSVDEQLYETVNNLPNHYVGMHAELTPLLAPHHASFVCFQPADVGGEFLLLDGRRVWQELDQSVLQRILDKKIRFKVAGFDFSFLKGTAKGLRKPLMTLFEKAFLGLTKSKFDLTCHWKEVEGKLLLEALEPVQSAVTRHPDTKEITWVCNVHNHSRYLRNRRPCDVPEVAMTETYYGDMSEIPVADIEHINEVTERCIQRIKMEVCSTHSDVLFSDFRHVLSIWCELAISLLCDHEHIVAIVEKYSTAHFSTV